MRKRSIGVLCRLQGVNLVNLATAATTTTTGEAAEAAPAAIASSVFGFGEHFQETKKKDMKTEEKRGYKEIIKQGGHEGNRLVAPEPAVSRLLLESIFTSPRSPARFITDSKRRIACRMPSRQ